MIIEWILRKLGDSVDRIHLARDVTRFCEHGYELSGFIRGLNFEYLSGYSLLKTDSPP
jgi:hypothetical protein